MKNNGNLKAVLYNHHNYYIIAVLLQEGDSCFTLE